MDFAAHQILKEILASKLLTSTNASLTHVTGANRFLTAAACASPVQHVKSQISQGADVSRISSMTHVLEVVVMQKARFG